MSPVLKSGSRPARRVAVRLLLPAAVVLLFVAIPVYRAVVQSRADDAVVIAAPVFVGEASLGTAERTAVYSGTLTPESTTIIVPKVSGRVLEVAVRENDSVVAGDLIARIEDEVLRLQVAGARAAYDAASAQYRQAQRGARAVELEIVQASVDQAVASLEAARANLERTERLFQAGSVSRSAFEDARDRFQNAETEVQNARRSLLLMQDGAGEEELDIVRANLEAVSRQLELAELQLDFAAVRAPVSGTVARVLTEPGQTVGPQSALATLVNDRLINARIMVPERLYARFRGREGSMEVRVKPLAYEDDEPFRGTVTTVASVIDAASRTFGVEVALPNADGRLRPGMFVNATFVLDSTANAVLVPSTAVHFRDGRTVVFEYEDGRAVVRPVVVEELPGALTQVSAGLLPGDAIIVEGAAFLQDGSLVVEARDR